MSELAELGEAAWTARDLYPIVVSLRGDRAALAAEVLRLREAGLLYREISAALGISYSYAQSLISDPDGAKARARKETYRGRCGRCGDPTDGSNGREGAPLYCARCTPIVRRENYGWTRPRIIAAFQEAARILGRSPTTNDRTIAPSIQEKLSPSRRAETAALQAAIAGGLRFPSPGVVQDLFGSWAAALEAAGLPSSPIGGAAHRNGRRPRAVAAPPSRPVRVSAGTVCPSCGDFVSRLDERTGWCTPCTKAVAA